MAVDDNRLSAAPTSSHRHNVAQAALSIRESRSSAAVRRLAGSGAALKEVVDALGFSPESANRMLAGKGTDLQA